MLGVLVHRDHALFCPVPGAGAARLRGIGGAVGDGETPEHAVLREFLAQSGLDVEVWGALGAVEVRPASGPPALAYEFVVRLPKAGARAPLPSVEVRESRETQPGVWLPLAEVLAGVHPLFPDGLHERLAAWVNTL